jgi:hypothetical protein
MLANMMESDKKKRWTFEIFFGEVFKIKDMLHNINLVQNFGLVKKAFHNTTCSCQDIADNCSHGLKQN